MTRKEVLPYLSDCDFDSYLCEYTCERAVLDHLPDYWDWETGASRLVIIPSSDFVIKIPFDGDDSGFFTGACGGWDYCGTELALYRSARHARLGDFFCKPSYIGTIGRRPIYIQEYADPFYKADWYARTRASLDKAKESLASNGMKYQISEDWCADAINYFGETRFNRFLQFLTEHEISDLHGANIGYIDDRPVVIDYATYNG